MAQPVYVLGGYQTDFARHLTREGLKIFDLMREAAQGALAGCAVEAGEVEVGHVGNFVGELLCQQGHLGGLLVEADPAFSAGPEGGLPTARHEAACASGGVAVLQAMAELEAGRYDLALVLGVELMRGVQPFEAQSQLGVAAWVPRETEGVAYPWPHLLGQVGEEYRQRHGLSREHLVALARKNFANARRNPRAQARGWTLTEQSFAEDDVANPVIAGGLRRYDCSPVSDGAAALLLASAGYARGWAQRRRRTLERQGREAGVARLLGWGHRTGRMALADKLAVSQGRPYLFPHIRAVVQEAFRRAGIAGVQDLDAVECHDCFTTMEYMALDHLGFGPPGQPWRAIEDGTVAFGGRCPVNPSGGLLGGGHPVGASGVRMVLDAVLQVQGLAGDYQVPGARRVATLNIGGSATTAVAFVVGAD